MTSSSFAYTYSVNSVNGGAKSASFNTNATSVAVNLEVFGGFGGYALAQVQIGSAFQQLSSGNSTLKYYSGILNSRGSGSTITLLAETAPVSSGPYSYAYARASW
ncbi:MAG: hypothetical protein JXC36_04260 [Candidatus Atribacteria bacterium]|nr:hypothetical protein [Candidatus Atribacteria bacterium]